jgi:hypothetical protein
MKKVELTTTEAIMLHKECTESGKKLLEDKFGKEAFIYDWTSIKTFEQACEIQGVDPESIFPYKTPKNGDELSLNAHAKLIVIARAINHNVEPNWDDQNEYKYYPYFDMRSGVGFSLSFCGYCYSSTYVGSRLSFRTREKAEYAGKQFLEIYKDLIK